MITYEQVKANNRIHTLVDKANEYLNAIGYTEHGPRHVGYVSKIAGRILHELGYSENRVELAKIAGWTHDIGNMFNRKYHAISGAVLLFDELQKLGMSLNDTCDICTAVGNHDENCGRPVSDISAALIIADKIDAYKARVRTPERLLSDIHDRVNLSIYKTHVAVSKEKKRITFEMKMKDHATPMEFMEIYLSRMKMCEESAAYLDCTFRLVINGLVMNEAGGKHY